MRKAIEIEVTKRIRGLQNRREFLVKQLEMFEAATILNDNGKKVIEDTNADLKVIADEMEKLVEMKDEDILKDLAEQAKYYNHEHSSTLTAKDIVQINIENMII